jgi:hypothetical protein
MQRSHTYTSWIAGVGLVTLCSIGLPPAALAAPPADTAHPLHLDLRPPAFSELAGLEAALMRQRRAPFRGATDDAGARGISMPSLIGTQETLVHRFRREGLPIARLWENHSAMVSLGFSPRGKPGLWLVQKTH